MILLAVHGNELIHDSAARADEVVFGLLAKLRDNDRIQLPARNFQKSFAHGDFEGEAEEIQSRALRNIAIQEEICARHAANPGLQELNDSYNVIAPVTSRHPRQFVQIIFDTLRVVFRSNHEEAVGPVRNRDPGLKTDCDRENESLVVVGMFSNEIHAARSPHEQRRAP